MRILGLYIETSKTRTKNVELAVARAAYNLTHEFVTGKLMDEFDHGGWTTAHKRPVLLDLDKEMKAFVATKEE